MGEQEWVRKMCRQADRYRLENEEQVSRWESGDWDKSWEGLRNSGGWMEGVWSVPK